MFTHFSYFRLKSCNLFWAFENLNNWYGWLSFCKSCETAGIVEKDLLSFSSPTPVIDFGGSVQTWETICSSALVKGDVSWISSAEKGPSSNLIVTHSVRMSFPLANNPWVLWERGFFLWCYLWKPAKAPRDRKVPLSGIYFSIDEPLYDLDLYTIQTLKSCLRITAFPSTP